MPTRIPQFERRGAGIDRRSRTERLRALATDLLVLLGEDPDRDGLKETPARWARMWEEWATYDAGKLDTGFQAITADSLVAVSGIKVWSTCEHHLLPFSCEFAMGYITRDRVLGLSKFARIAHKYAHRLQVQERLTEQIADEIAALTKSEDVAVVAKGQHLCMAMRGIRTPADMHTSVMRGAFRQNHEARAEFLRLIGR